MRMNFRARCFQCGKENNAAAPVNVDEEAIPDQDDLMLCFYCGTFMMVDFTMPDNVRKPTPAESREIKADRDLQKVHEAWFFHKMQERK